MAIPRIANPRHVVPNASPAPVTGLAAAVVPAGASASGTVPRWYVLSSDGETARCWPAGSGPGGVDGGPRYGGLPDGLVLTRLALVHLDNGADTVVASARPPRFPGDRKERALLRWDRQSGQPIGDPLLYTPPQVPPGFRDPLAVAATSAGPLAATNSADGGVQLWDLVTGQPAGGPLGREHGPVLALAAGTFADGSPVILSAGTDSAVRRWDPASGTEIGEPMLRCGHAVALEITRLPDDRRVVTVLSAKGSLHRRDLLTGEALAPKIITGWKPGVIMKACTGPMAVVATDDGAVIAASNDRGRSVQLWDLVSGEPRGELRHPQPATVFALASARLPDGTPLLLSGDSLGSVHGFDARDGHPVGEPVQPHGMRAARVHPVTAPDGRLLLTVEGASTRLVDARTGEPAGGQWEIDSRIYATTVVPLADGRIISASAHSEGLALHDARSGAAFAPPHDFTLWDIAAATLPDGRVVIGGAGHDWLVYRWDAATGEPIGEPLRGHRLSVFAITVARQADGQPMFVTGCERGEVLRWDAATGARIGLPLPGTGDTVRDLAVVDLPDGRQILAGLDDHALYRWDPVTGDPLGPPVDLAGSATFTGMYVDQAGVPFGFVKFHHGHEDDPEGKQVKRWRLDSATRVGPPLPATFRAAFDDDGVTWMVLAEPDGSLVVCPLPPAETEPGDSPDGHH